jgi:hypothetical protein
MTFKYECTKCDHTHRVYRRVHDSEPRRPRHFRGEAQMNGTLYFWWHIIDYTCPECHAMTTRSLSLPEEKVEDQYFPCPHCGGTAEQDADFSGPLGKLLIWGERPR